MDNQIIFKLIHKGWESEYSGIKVSTEPIKVRIGDHWEERWKITIVKGNNIDMYLCNDVYSMMATITKHTNRTPYFKVSEA